MAQVKIYTTSFCPYCVAAKNLFQSLGQPYEEINLDGQNELREELSRANGGWRTVPMIFINERFQGGFTDVKALHDKGQLLPLLQNTGGQA